MSEVNSAGQVVYKGDDVLNLGTPKRRASAALLALSGLVLDPRLNSGPVDVISSHRLRPDSALSVFVSNVSPALSVEDCQLTALCSADKCLALGLHSWLALSSTAVLRSVQSVWLSGLC